MAKKKQIIITIILILAIAIPVGLYIAGNVYYSAERIYEQTWKIELPEKMKEKLDIKDGNSSHNDGIRYTVYEIKEHSDFFDGFSSEKSPEFETAFKANLSALKLSAGEQPNWDNDYVWKQMNLYENHLYMIFDSETNTFFITQKMQ